MKINHIVYDRTDYTNHKTYFIDIDRGGGIIIV